MELINTLAAAYAEKYSSPEPDWAQALAVETRTVHPKHHMLSGHVQGQFVGTFTNHAAKLYFRNCTFTGYSAGCLVAGLTPQGELHTIECREQDAAIATRFWKQLPQAHQIHLHLGDAINIIPSIDQVWDLVFLDADKTNYCNYYKMIMPKLRKGGLLIADNVFFHGEVLQPTLSGKNAIAIQQFNEMVAADTSCEKVVVTIRDGITLIVKK